MVKYVKIHYDDGLKVNFLLTRQDNYITTCFTMEETIERAKTFETLFTYYNHVKESLFSTIDGDLIAAYPDHFILRLADMSAIFEFRTLHALVLRLELSRTKN